jgi:predicted ATPase
VHLKRITIDHSRFPVADRYPYTLPLVRETESISFTTPVTFFVGENGCGKSTVLEAVCRACGVHIWELTQTARVNANEYERSLHLFVRPEWAAGPVPGAHFGSDRFRDFSALLEEWAVADPGQLKYFGGKSLLAQSHGQSLMSCFGARFARKGIYFLDEPETALSPRTQLGFVDVLAQAVASGRAQFIIATHSPILMSMPGATIYSFDASPVVPVEYEKTDHYRTYREFFDGR